MQDDFWEVCRKYDVIVEPTYYPVKIDYDGLKKTAESKNIKYRPFSDRNTMQKLTLVYRTLYDRFMSNAKRSYLSYKIASNCVTLRDGRMHPCSTAADALHLKNISIWISLNE